MSPSTKRAGKVFCLIAVIFMVFQLIVHLTLMIQTSMQLGFWYATPWENGTEVFIITHSMPGKMMYEAGLREGDYVLLRSVDDLYHRLIFSQGKQVCIPVRRMEQYLTVCLSVPVLKLSFPPEWVLWLF